MIWCLKYADCRMLSIEAEFCWLITFTITVDKTCSIFHFLIKLEILSKAQHESTQRPKFNWGVNSAAK